MTHDELSRSSLMTVTVTVIRSLLADKQELYVENLCQRDCDRVGYAC